MAPRCVNSTCL